MKPWSSILWQSDRIMIILVTHRWTSSCGWASERSYSLHPIFIRLDSTEPFSLEILRTVFLSIYKEKNMHRKCLNWYNWVPLSCFITVDLTLVSCAADEHIVEQSLRGCSALVSPCVLADPVTGGLLWVLPPEGPLSMIGSPFPAPYANTHI